MKKENEKVFTKVENEIIIEKKSTCSRVNYIMICKGEGLFMKENKKKVLTEIKEELNLKDRIILHIFPKTFLKIYAIAGKNTFNNMYLS